MAFGNDMTLSLRIAAKDETQGALKSAMGGLSGFARAAAKPITLSFGVAGGGLAFLRDINLGLRPVIEGIDNLIERGGSLELVRKNFEALSGSRFARTDALGQSLQSASLGMVKLGDSLRFANQALLADVSLRDLPTIFEFASKRAMAFGEDAGGAIESIIHMIHSGNFRGLKQLGIDLGDVANQFEEMQSGSFSKQEFAARRAQVLAAAVAKMRDETAKLNVSGNEPLVLWKGLKTEIGDAADKLALAIVGSTGLRENMKDLRDFIGGISQHFERGGGVWELLTGKGKSEGLFGIAKGALVDAGEWVFEGIKKGWSILIKDVPDKIVEGLKWLKTDFIPALTTWREESIKALSSWFSTGAIGEILFGKPNPKGGSTGGLFNLPQMIAEIPSESWARLGSQILQAIGKMFESETWRSTLKNARAGEVQWNFFPPGMIGVETHRAAAIRAYRAEFPNRPAGEAAQAAAGFLGIDEARFPFTSAARANRRAELARLESQYGHLTGRDAFGDYKIGGRSGPEFIEAQRAARAAADGEIRRFVAEGRKLTGRDRRMIFEGHLDEEVGKRANPIREGIEALRKDLLESDVNRERTGDVNRILARAKGESANEPFITRYNDELDRPFYERRNWAENLFGGKDANAAAEKKSTAANEAIKQAVEISGQALRVFNVKMDDFILFLKQVLVALTGVESDLRAAPQAAR